MFTINSFMTRAPAPASFPLAKISTISNNLGLAALLTLGVVACGSSGDDGVSYSTGPASRAIVATRAADYSSGQIERISLSTGDSYDGSYTTTNSDLAVGADATHLYEIGKSDLDSITKRSPDDLSSLVYQRSVAGDDVFANPYQIVFADVTTAYLIRYGSNEVWVIDPSATNEEDFKTGEFDISAYGDSENAPGANSGVLVGDKLFVMMERLVSFTPVQQGYIAVFDTTTGEEIDTGMGAADGLKGIPLGVFNPASLQQPIADGPMYAVGRGNYFATDDSAGDRYSGGVVSINPDTYEVALILDDGDEQSATETGFFIDLLVISEAQAYLITQTGFGNDTLRRLDPGNPALATDAVAQLAGLPITTLAAGPNDRLWVGLDRAEMPGFKLLNLSDDSVASEHVPTALVPINVVFIDTSGESETP